MRLQKFFQNQAESFGPFWETTFQFSMISLDKLRGWQPCPLFAIWNPIAATHATRQRNALAEYLKPRSEGTENVVTKKIRAAEYVRMSTEHRNRPVDVPCLRLAAAVRLGPSRSAMA